MTDTATDPKHPTKAVTEPGEKSPVLMAHTLTVPIEQSVASISGVTRAQPGDSE